MLIILIKSIRRHQSSGNSSCLGSNKRAIPLTTSEYMIIKGQDQTADHQPIGLSILCPFALWLQNLLDWLTLEIRLFLLLYRHKVKVKLLVFISVIITKLGRVVATREWIIHFIIYLL